MCWEPYPVSLLITEKHFTLCHFLWWSFSLWTRVNITCLTEIHCYLDRWRNDVCSCDKDKSSCSEMNNAVLSNASSGPFLRSWAWQIMVNLKKNIDMIVCTQKLIGESWNSVVKYIYIWIQIDSENIFLHSSSSFMEMSCSLISGPCVWIYQKHYFTIRSIILQSF